MASYAVIIAGGGGTRLWPASRRRRPKQFLALGTRAGESLIEATARRVAGACDRLLVVTTAAHADEVRRALPGLPPEGVIAEPVGRNTAPAVGLAAALLGRSDPEAVLAVLPADHHVADEEGFRRVVADALAIAGSATEPIVTVGIRPTRPETGYGYVRTGGPAAAGAERGALAVEAFVEKPDGVTARRWLDEGRHLWNSGMFFFRARRMLAEMRRHLPELAAALDEVAAAPDDAAARAAAARLYPSLPAISLDYGVMERARGIVVLPADFGWNDVGGWAALADVRAADDDGSVVVGRHLARDAGRNLVWADEGRLVALVGVSDLVVVAAGDVVLVCPRDRAQEFRELVADLERRGLDRWL